MLVGLAFAGAALPAVAASAISTPKGLIADQPASAAGVRLFKGIPYASPPVGDLRWRAPQPVEPWQGARAADRFGPRCMQLPKDYDRDPLNGRTSEDCLYLNLWTPAKDPNEGLPVMVWLHGGGYNIGSGSEPWFNGENLAKRGIIVITVSYRLNVFGFLSHPELSKESGRGASGNYGIMDQRMALQWVQDNIKAFGGDPRAVTVVGESAGGTSISVLTSSPESRNLLRGAIAESGAGLWGLQQNIRTPADADARGAKFATMLEASGIDALRRMPAEDVLNAANLLGAGFGLVWDGYMLPKDAGTASVLDIPMIIGWNADEGTRFNLSTHFNLKSGDFARSVRARYGDKAEAVLAMYPHATSDEEHASSDSLIGDERIVFPSFKWARTREQKHVAPTYVYEFAVRPPAPAVSQVSSAGAFHTAEIVYVFDNLQARDWPWRQVDRTTATAMASYWVNFIKTGDPNGGGLAMWSKYTGKDEVMNFTESKVGMGPLRNAPRFKLFDEVYESRSKR